MLSYLHLLGNEFFPFRLFEYATFRAGGAALTAFLTVALFGGRFAAMLRRMNVRAGERLEGLVPAELIDRRKKDTPCMGGILIVGAMTLSALLWTRLNSPVALLIICSTAAFSLIGFYDDYRKVAYQDRDGLPERWKFLLQCVVAGADVFLLFRIGESGALMSGVMVPFFKEPVIQCAHLSAAIAVLALVGVCNAVNLTDGKDGLATGCTIFCAVTYAAFVYLSGHRIFAQYLSIPYIPGAGEAMVYTAGMIGACIGFLWHNCHPASMFMGDTGSLALGGAVGLLAVIVRQEILLILVGGVFVMEAGSVLLQRAGYKLFHKRIFGCTPIHHTFEKEKYGWTENQIVVRFWILSGIFALLALATLKLR